MCIGGTRPPRSIAPGTTTPASVFRPRLVGFGGFAPTMAALPGGGGAVPEIPVPPAAPAVTAERARDIAERRARERAQRQTTILTGPEGIEEGATIRRRTLLGV